MFCKLNYTRFILHKFFLHPEKAVKNQGGGLGRAIGVPNFTEDQRLNLHTKSSSDRAFQSQPAQTQVCQARHTHVENLLGWFTLSFMRLLNICLAALFPLFVTLTCAQSSFISGDTITVVTDAVKVREGALFW
jgi:hypothetical protein